MKFWGSLPERRSSIYLTKRTLSGKFNSIKRVPSSTFNFLLGRHRITHLLLGVTSASEVLQERNESTFGNIDGVFCIADDMILAATTPAEHDAIARKVLDRAQQKNVKFNPNKVHWKVAEVKYMHHVLTSAEVRPDEDKVQVVLELPTPQSRLELQQVLGVVNYLGRFIPNMSTVVENNSISTSWISTPKENL